MRAYTVAYHRPESRTQARWIRGCASLQREVPSLLGSSASSAVVDVRGGRHLLATRSS